MRTLGLCYSSVLGHVLLIWVLGPPAPLRYRLPMVGQARRKQPVSSSHSATHHTASDYLDATSTSKQNTKTSKQSQQNAFGLRTFEVQAMRIPAALKPEFPESLDPTMSRLQSRSPSKFRPGMQRTSSPMPLQYTHRTSKSPEEQQDPPVAVFIMGRWSYALKLNPSTPCQ